MRQPTYLSPSALSLFYTDRSEYYLRYMADIRKPRTPQTQPMAIGSGFDAFAKSWLSEKIFDEIRPGFALEQIFEDQVAEHNRDWAWEHSKYVFECYKECGALDDMLKELDLAESEPKFEDTVSGEVSLSPEGLAVTFLGKPDVYFTTKTGALVVLDWKVNGYCSRAGISPKPGYIMLLDCYKPHEGRRSYNHHKSHKNCFIEIKHGMQVNTDSFFEEINWPWADQLAIYSWLLGEPVGAQTIIGIDQIVCKPRSNDGKPLLRVARHRSHVSEEYQKNLFKRALNAWQCVKSGHVFQDMSYEDSKRRCEILDNHYNTPDRCLPDDDEWFNEITRQMED